jgi:VWFA-related protein
MRGPIGGIAVIALGGAALLAAGQNPPPQRPPAIRSGVVSVPIDVRVVDNKGNPVTDLKQEDFTVLENGVPQTIRHFSTQAFTADSSAALPAPVFRKAGTAETVPQNRRVFLFLLARGRHQDVSKYVDAMIAFLQNGVMPQDQVAMLAWNRATDFTTDRALLARTLTRFRERHAKIETDLREWFSGLRAVYGSKEIPPHIQREIDAVFQDASGLRPRAIVPGQITDAKPIDEDVRRTSDEIMRKALNDERVAAGGSSLPDLSAEITAGMNDMTFDEYVQRAAGSLHDLSNFYAAIDYLRYLEGEKHLVVLTEQGLMLPRRENVVSVARLAADARIAMDIVHTGGTVGAPPPVFIGGRGGGGPMYRVSPTATPSQVFQQTFNISDLRSITDLTGGQLFAFKTGKEAFGTLDRTLRFQYVLGYYPSDTSLDRKFRNITVKVNRPGARAYYRQGYFAADRLVPLDRREFLTFSRMRAAARYAGVLDQIRVTTVQATDTGSGAGRVVVIKARIELAHVKFTRVNDRHTASINLGLYAGDDKDRIVGETQQTVDLGLTDDALAKAQRDGVVLDARLAVSAQPRSLKIIVYDYGSDLLGSSITRIAR